MHDNWPFFTDNRDVCPICWLTDIWGISTSITCFRAFAFHILTKWRAPPPQRFTTLVPQPLPVFASRSPSPHGSPWPLLFYKYIPFTEIYLISLCLILHDIYRLLTYYKIKSKKFLLSPLESKGHAKTSFISSQKYPQMEQAFNKCYFSNGWMTCDYGIVITAWQFVSPKPCTLIVL